ncbi:MAG: hypothetical protein NVS4B5_16540 [Vulcanimicrobiaceae bacterium]
MTAVNDWGAGLITGITAGLTRLFATIPNIIGAVLLLIIGWIIAGIIGKLVTRLLRVVHLDTVADRIGVNAFLVRSGTKLRASDIFGLIITWVVRLTFVEMAAEQLGMPQVSLVINQILGFVPNIIVAMVILAVGAFLGQLLGGIVRGTASEAGLGNPAFLAKLASGAVMAFAVIAALNELNIAPIVVNTLYIGLVAALALALGLAFGLGGRDTAARLTEKWTKNAGSAAEKLAATNPSSATSSVKPSTAPAPRLVTNDVADDLNATSARPPIIAPPQARRSNR